MNYNVLSFVAVLTAILSVFLGVQSLKGTEGQAEAAVSRSADPSTENKAPLSASEMRKRAIRRAMIENSENVMSLNAAEIRAVLRQPGLVRRDLPTIVWQYRNEACVLDLYFTTSASKAKVAPVVHYEIRARQKGVSDDDVQKSCIGDLVREQAGGVNFANLEALYKAQ